MWVRLQLWVGSPLRMRAKPVVLRLERPAQNVILKLLRTPSSIRYVGAPPSCDGCLVVIAASDAAICRTLEVDGLWEARSNRQLRAACNPTYRSEHCPIRSTRVHVTTMRMPKAANRVHGSFPFLHGVQKP